MTTGQRPQLRGFIRVHDRGATATLHGGRPVRRTSRIRRALSPMYLSTIALATTFMKEAFKLHAKARACEAAKAATSMRTDECSQRFMSPEQLSRLQSQQTQTVTRPTSQQQHQVPELNSHGTNDPHTTSTAAAAAARCHCRRCSVVCQRTSSVLPVPGGP